MPVPASLGIFTCVKHIAAFCYFNKSHNTLVDLDQRLLIEGQSPRHRPIKIYLIIGPLLDNRLKEKFLKP